MFQHVVLKFQKAQDSLTLTLKRSTEIKGHDRLEPIGRSVLVNMVRISHRLATVNLRYRLIDSKALLGKVRPNQSAICGPFCVIKDIVFAAPRNEDFSNGICRRVRVGRMGLWADGNENQRTE